MSGIFQLIAIEWFDFIDELIFREFILYEVRVM